ncbi:MAG: VOC family protein [Dehalococcoidia bacterium]|jgi:catechol 2,3-dioxygenase-like lactoylglutathione lyase family enzyme|nr:VOC family protein [Dehalococcoidia bacterium]
MCGYNTYEDAAKFREGATVQGDTESAAGLTRTSKSQGVDIKMVTGFNHSGFVVNDLEMMVRFYRDSLVIREVDSVAPPAGDRTGIPRAHRTLVFLRREGAEHGIELVHFIDPPSPDGHLDRNQLGAAHLCFNVGDLENLHSRLKEERIEFVTPPKFRETPGGGRRGICYPMDPEGNWLEFIEGS